MPLSQYAIGNDLDDCLHLFRTIVIKPLHHDSKHAHQIKFHNICTFFFGDSEAYKNGVEDVPEHSVVYFIHIHGVELFDGDLENALIFLYEGQIRRKVFGGYKHQILPVAIFKVLGNALCVCGIIGEMLIEDIPRGFF